MTDLSEQSQEYIDGWKSGVSNATGLEQQPNRHTAKEVLETFVAEKSDEYSEGFIEGYSWGVANVTEFHVPTGVRVRND